MVSCLLLLPNWSFFFCVSGTSSLFIVTLVALRLQPRSAAMLISSSPCIRAYAHIFPSITSSLFTQLLLFSVWQSRAGAAHILLHLNSAAVNIQRESHWWSGPSDFISTHTPSRCIMNIQSGWSESCLTEAQFRKCISAAAPRLRQQNRTVTFNERRCRGVALGHGLLADALHDSGRN